MAASYVVWDEDNKLIIQVARPLKEGETHEILHKKLCVYLDTTYTPDTKEKYGMWNSYDSKNGTCNNWEHIPYEDFPKEFKTALLLQGIT